MGKSPIAIGSSNGYAKSITKAKKMGFRQRFRNWLFDESNSIAKSSYYEETVARPNFDNGINFTIHKASGGLVVNVHSYDSTRDRSQSNLYVIQDDDTIGESLSKILTMENLKR